jgi:hypothetical protein
VAVPGPRGLKRKGASEISSESRAQPPLKAGTEELGQGVRFYASQEVGAECPSRQTTPPRSC